MHIYEVQGSNITNSCKHRKHVLCYFRAYVIKITLKHSKIFFGRKWFKSIRGQASCHLAVTVSVPSAKWHWHRCQLFFFAFTSCTLMRSIDWQWYWHWQCHWHSLAFVRKMLSCCSQAIHLGKCYHAAVRHCIGKLISSFSERLCIRITAIFVQMRHAYLWGSR